MPDTTVPGFMVMDPNNSLEEPDIAYFRACIRKDISPIATAHHPIWMTKDGDVYGSSDETFWHIASSGEGAIEAIVSGCPTSPPYSPIRSAREGRAGTENV